MNVTLTLKEISDKYDWCMFCWIKGYNYYCLLSDKTNPETKVIFSKEEAEMIGYLI